MNAVVAAQRVTLSELSGVLAQRFSDLNGQVLRPIGVERSRRRSEGRATECTLATSAGQRGPRLRVGDHGCRNDRGAVDMSSDTVAARFRHVQFHEAAVRSVIVHAEGCAGLVAAGMDRRRKRRRGRGLRPAPDHRWSSGTTRCGTISGLLDDSGPSHSPSGTAPQAPAQPFRNAQIVRPGCHHAPGGRRRQHEHHGCACRAKEETAADDADGHGKRVCHGIPLIFRGSPVT